MAQPDFLKHNLAAQCEDLAGEINKVYQHLPWARKNEVIVRLKRNIHQLAEEVQKAQASQSAMTTQTRLREAISLVHECVPLLSLLLKKVLVSPELHTRWIKQLNDIDKALSTWLKGATLK
jgi:predicted GTPase